MKAGWKATKLGAAIDLLAGFAFKSAQYTDSDDGVRLLRGDNIVQGRLRWEDVKKWPSYDTETYSQYELREGDVVLAMDRPWVKAGLKHAMIAAEDLPCLLVQRTARLRPGPSLDNRFLMYLIGSGAFTRHTLGVQTGLGVPHISGQQIKDFQFAMPPLSEQWRIVGILDEAFDGIATAKANAEKNLQNARDLFESHLQAVFTQRGEGWVEKCFAEVCEISSVLVDPRQAEYQQLPHVGGANIETKTGGLSGLKTAQEEGLISGKFLFDETMVLYSKIRPYLMKVARPDFKGLCSADIYPLSVKQGLDRDFLFHLLLSPKFTEYAVAGSARAGMPKVNRDHLFAFRVHLPDLVTAQKRYANQLDALQEETQRLESIYQRKLAALDELKKSLLHRAFSGQL